jgi:hypothetical protein
MKQNTLTALQDETGNRIVGGLPVDGDTAGDSFCNIVPDGLRRHALGKKGERHFPDNDDVGGNH